MSKLSKHSYDIKSYEDLQAARDQLKNSIKEQEQSLLESPVVKIVDSLKSKDSMKSSLLKSLPDLKFEAGEKILSSFLISNKVTRKYFAGYLVAKEMVPYVIDKVKSIVNSKDKSSKKNLEENNTEPSL